MVGRGPSPPVTGGGIRAPPRPGTARSRPVTAGASAPPRASCGGGTGRLCPRTAGCHPRRMAALDDFNAEPADRAVQALRACNAAPRFATAIVAAGPIEATERENLHRIGTCGLARSANPCAVPRRPCTVPIGRYWQSAELDTCKAWHTQGQPVRTPETRVPPSGRPAPRSRVEQAFGSCDDRRVAGGMHRGRHGESLADRAARSWVTPPAGPPRPAAELGRDGRRPAGDGHGRHCWVRDPPEEPGIWPGLLVEWHQREDGWHGRSPTPSPGTPGRCWWRPGCPPSSSSRTEQAEDPADGPPVSAVAAAGRRGNS